MKKFLPIFVLLTALTMIGVSCKTTPSEGSADDPSTYKGATTRAGASRQRVIDFEGPDYFPSEWEEVEAQYTAAAELPKAKAPEMQTAIETYNAIADSYDEIFSKTIPLYAQAREDEIMAVRDQITGSGFSDAFPQYLQSADEIALSALDQYEAKDYYKAKDTAAKALSEYETLLAGAKVYSARREILDRGFREFDPDNFDLADEVAKKAIEEYEAGNKEAAVSKAEEALLRYNIVLNNGWVSYAAVRRETAASERELALEEKANIAARDTFRSADVLFNQAETKFTAENFSEAGLLFIEAEAFFVLSRQETEGKRLRAEERIRMAEEKIEESNEAASEAERIIEGGSR